MSKFETLEVASRNTTTHGEVNILRKSGKIPGIIYGSGKENKKVCINELVLRKAISGGSVLSKIFNIVYGDSTETAVIREIQFHPVTDKPQHVDFMRIGGDGYVHISVPVLCLNEAASPALKKGGVLNIVLREIDLQCSVNNVPNALEVDLTGIDFHHTIKLSDLKLPEGARLATKLPLNSAVITVVTPSSLRSEINKTLSEEGDSSTESAKESTDSAS